MKKLLLSIVLVCGLVTQAYAVVTLDYMEYSSDANAQAAYVTNGEIVNQSQTSSDSELRFGDQADLEFRQAQGFQLPATVVVTAVEVKQASTTGTPTGNWTLRIETDSAGVPSGTLANANASVVVSPPGDGISVKGTFATPFSLTASTQYHLVILCDNQTTNNRWGITCIVTAAPYPSGSSSQSSDGGATWTALATIDDWFKIYTQSLQCYSEATIKTQGTYSLKAIAVATDSLNKTLTRTVAPTIDLTGMNQIKLDLYSSRTGSNIKIGIHDSGGTTTELTPSISSANTWETKTWDISAVSDANKDAINSIIITKVNADADNTFYIDNMYGAFISAGGITKRRVYLLD